MKNPVVLSLKWSDVGPGDCYNRLQKMTAKNGLDNHGLEAI